MNNMFSIDDLFSQMFPWLSGISWDLGTILTSIVFLWFLLLAFDWVKVMFDNRIYSGRLIKSADSYYGEAESILAERNNYFKESIEWEESNLRYKSFLRKSVDARVKSHSYRKK